MLESIDLKKKLDAETYAAELPRLQRRLHSLFTTCWQQRIAVVLLLDGWYGAGQQKAAGILLTRLDPRGFSYHTSSIQEALTADFPWLRYFWIKLPEAGHSVIFCPSWYVRVFQGRAGGLVPEDNWHKSFRDILDFERLLVEGGVILIKAFFHISQKQQKRWIKKQTKAGYINAEIELASQQNRRYSDHLVAAEEMLTRTSSDHAPWHAIPSASSRFAHIQLMEIIVSALQRGLGEAAPFPSAHDDWAFDPEDYVDLLTARPAGEPSNITGTTLDAERD